MDIPALLPDTDPLLARVMPKFDFRTDNAKELEAILLTSMEHYEAVGLAANQIGIEADVCAVRLGDSQNPRPIVMFNPVLTWLSPDTVAMDEGCLTFEGIYLVIKRPKDVQVTFEDSAGVRQVMDLTGWEARIVLHETDHLAGVVFTSLVSKLRLSLAKKKALKQKKRLT